MINKGQLWHEKFTYEQVCSAGEEDPSQVIYNLHEDCLCLVEDNADLNQQLADLKASLSKVRADAVREAVGHFETIIERNDISVFQLNHYADKLEAGNE